MAARREPAVLVVALDTTSGWRSSSRELTEAIIRAGTPAQLITTGPVRRARSFMGTDLAQAWAARRAAERGIARFSPDAVIYCSITAALLWPRPGAIWVDSLAAENRPGRHGIWQRPVERRRLAAAPVVLRMSEGALSPFRPGAFPGAVTVPVAVSPSGPPAPDRDIDVLTYAGDPEKRRLDFILDTWARARREGETMVVAGTTRPSAPPGVRFTGGLGPQAYRELVRRARVFLAAPRREDYGIAPLEALADGCLLVSTPAPGPYPALALARTLDPRLVSEELTAAVRAALDDPIPGYARRAAELLEPFGRAAVDRTVADGVLPRLLTR